MELIDSREQLIQTILDEFNITKLNKRGLNLKCGSIGAWIEIQILDQEILEKGYVSRKQNPNRETYRFEEKKPEGNSGQQDRENDDQFVDIRYSEECQPSFNQSTERQKLDYGVDEEQGFPEEWVQCEQFSLGYSYNQNDVVQEQFSLGYSYNQNDVVQEQEENHTINKVQQYDNYKYNFDSENTLKANSRKNKSGLQQDPVVDEMILQGKKSLAIDPEHKELSRYSMSPKKRTVRRTLGLTQSFNLDKEILDQVHDLNVIEATPVVDELKKKKKNGLSLIR